MGPGLGGRPATSGVISMDSNMMDARQFGGRHEKVGVTLLKRMCGGAGEGELGGRDRRGATFREGPCELGGDHNLKGFQAEGLGGRTNTLSFKMPPLSVTSLFGQCLSTILTLLETPPASHNRGNCLIITC